MKLHTEKTLESYITDIQNYYQKYHKVPTRSEFSKIEGYGSAYTTSARFGKTWNEMLCLAGLSKTRTIPFKDMSQTEILENFIQQYQRLNPKHKKDFDSRSKFKSYHYISHLKMSWKEMVEAAGGTVKERRHVSDQELIQQYISFSQSIGAKNGASIRQINESSAISNYSVFQKRFSTIGNLKRLAGFNPEQ